MEWSAMAQRRLRPLRLWLMLAAASASLIFPATASARGLCPPRCSCDDAFRSAACVAADLEVVPIQLNPEARHINLTGNRIYNVHFTLGFYPKLVTLDISHNRIESLGSRNFESNFDMIFLNASSNSIDGLDKNVFIGLKELITLDVSSNAISKIHQNAFRDLGRLQELRLSNNRLSSFEADLFKPLVNLRTLLLNSNTLLQIPTDNLVHTANLEYLSLSSNSIETIEEAATPSLGRLKRLELAENVISDMHHSSLDGLVTLQYLNLDRNNLSYIPTAALSKLTNLTHLSLSENFFDSIPPVSFQSLFHLRHLHLSRLGSVTRIDVRAFVDNINLERIWLNYNIRLSTIPSRTFHGNPRLTHIYVKDNALVTVDENQFPLEQLQSLQLSGNPFHCNCSLLWLWNMGHDTSSKQVTNLTDTPSLSIDFPDIRCATPKHLENKTLVGVPQSEIRCSFDWITISTIVMSLSILISLMVSLLYYIGPLKRCTKEKKHALTDSDLTSNLPKMANGMMYTANHQRPSDDKVEINRYLMMAPQAQDAYHSTPPWHTMNKQPIEDDDLMENMYQQFGYESIPHHKTMERPHIVYV